jgi:hypothetical protein
VNINTPNAGRHWEVDKRGECPSLDWGKISEQKKRGKYV